VRLPSALPPLLTASQAPDMCAFLDRCALRMEGVCNRLPPPRRELADGGSILCHHSAATLRDTQTPLGMIEGEVA
jgi:peptide/nickel transport system ATP-binding protein